MWSGDECVSGWQSPSRGRSMPGGVFDRAVTLSDCQAACARRFPDCLAINVEARPGTSQIICYLVGVLQPLNPASGFDNYQAIIASECQISSTYYDTNAMRYCMLSKPFANQYFGFIHARRVYVYSGVCVCPSVCPFCCFGE